MFIGWDKLGWNLDAMGMMGMLRGNFFKEGREILGESLE